MKKIYFLISIITITFIIFLIILFKPRNYELNYKINNFDIKETYQKNSNGYFFTINYENINYPLFINTKYKRKRKLISDIILNENGNEKCLSIIAFQETYLVCSKGNYLQEIDTLSDAFLNEFHYAKDKTKPISNYKNINIYNKNSNYFIWNYKGYNHINDDNVESLNIFDKDNYKNFLSYQTEKYLIFPDYDSEYYFNKIYVYDIEKDLLNDINFDFEISYDSYYLGNVNNKVYFIDKKNKNEYEINLKRNEIKKISKENNALFYNGSSWKEESLNKLINNELKFPIINIYHYTLEENHLYLNLDKYKILITNDLVKHIVYVNNKTIYYLVNDKLYKYEYLKRPTLLLDYSEWNFNYNNHIFIFD